MGVTLAVLWVLAASGEAVVDTARAYLGYPYVYGGKGQGFDCSSFVQKVYATHGYHLPRTSSLQAAVGRGVPWESLEPGDLLFFSGVPGGGEVGHVGIAVDRDRMIHASTGRAEVVIDPLDMRYYRERRLSARRVLDSPPELYPPAPSGAAQERGPPAFTLASGTGSSLWHYGPLPLARVRTALGVAAGGVALADARAAFITPQLMLRSEALDVDLVAQAPIAARLPHLTPLWSYDAAPAYLRVLEQLRIGRPESALYVEASRTLSLSLGHGLLVDRTTPAAYFASFAGLPVHGPFALAGRAALDSAEIELALDDVVAPAVVGVLVGYRRKASLRAMLAVDPNAPSTQGTRARGGMALEGVLPIYDVETVALNADLAVAGLDNAAAGVESGASLKLRRSRGELTLRGGLLVHDPGFAPHLFGVDYRVVREVGVQGEPLWGELDERARAAPWRWGFQLAAELSVTRRFGARASWRDDFPPGRDGAHLDNGVLALGVLARDVYTAERSSLSLHASYHRRTATQGVLSVANQNELVFAGLRLQRDSHFSLGVQVAKRTRAGATAWEGTAELSLNFGL